MRSRSIGLLILIVCSGNLLFSQTQYDSLKSLLFSEEISDSLKSDISYDISLFLTNNASLDSALKYSRLSLNYSKSNQQNSKLSRAYQLTGSILQKMGQNEESLRNLLLALQIAETDQDIRREATVYNELGNLYLGFNDWILALENYEQAYAKMEKLNLTSYLSIIRANIGLIYIDMADYETAIAMMKEAFLINPNMNPSIAANAFLNIGNAYRHLEELDTSMYYLNKSDSLINEYSFDHLRPFILYNKGLCILNLGDTVLAKSYLNQSLEWNKKIGTNRLLADVTFDFNLILNNEHKYDSSLLIAKQAYDLIEGSGNWRQIEKISRQLANLNEVLGNPTDELKYRKMAIAANDSINMAVTRTAILIDRFKRIKEESKLEFERKFNIIQKDKMLIAYLSTLVVLILSIVIVYRNRKIKKIRATMLEEIDQLKRNLMPLELVSNNDKDTKAIIKQKLEAHINKKLNQTDWNILNALYEDPLISNNDLANKVFLSLEGTSSSLRKMYMLFGIDVKSNKKMELLKQVILISTKP